MGYDDVPENSLLRQQGRTAKGPETLLNVNSKQVPQKRGPEVTRLMTGIPAALKRGLSG